MHITDLLENKIEVTDLGKAIEQAKAFKEFKSEIIKYYGDSKIPLKNYWTDVYKKLLKLEKHQKNEKVTKKDVAQWLGNLAESDIEDIKK